MQENNRIELLPGVWLRAVQTDKFKSSFLSITLMTPLQKETAGANALIPAVLRRGSVRHPDMESLSAALDEVYGGAIEPAVRKKGETQCVGLVASFLDDSYTPDDSQVLEPAAALLGEVLLCPATEGGVFRGEYVQGEKDNLIDRIRAQVNDKRRYAMQRLGQVMCPEEGFGIDRLGDEESVAAVTPASLWARYQTLLTESGIEIFYCGCADLHRVCGALSAVLKDLPRGGARIVPTCELRAHRQGEIRVVEERLDVTQGKLSIGFRTGGIAVCQEEYPALLMLNAVYGGTTLSKLFMNVRERLSLCYYASSVLEKMKGLLLVSSGVEFDKLQVAKDEILAQLDAIRRGEIEEKELEGARRILVGTLLAAQDGQNPLEDFWLGQAAAGLDEDIPALVARLESVTKEQVAAAAGRLEVDTIYFLKGQEG